MPKTTDAVKIIHQMIADDPTIKEQIALESLNSEIAQLIYDARMNAGLTQQQLADLIHVEQSVIEDLEDADYRGPTAAERGSSGQQTTQPNPEGSGCGIRPASSRSGSW